MRQLNINGPLYVGRWSSQVIFPDKVLRMYCRSNNNVLYSLLSLVSVFSPPWRRHERDRSSHQQTIRRRLGGLRVPLHTLHWLPLSAGGGRRWWQEHQHLHQLEDGSSTAAFLFFFFCPPGASASTNWFVILKLTNQSEKTENNLNFCSTNSKLTWLKTLWKTVRTHGNSNKTKKEKKRSDQRILQSTSTLWEERKKLSIVGNEGLWNTFLKDVFFFHGTILIVSLFFSTVIPPYSIAGRTEWPIGSRVIKFFMNLT